MAGIAKIRELEARKRALVTESEICRETLRADVQNLQLYGASFFKRIDQIRGIGPWLLLALPMAAPLVSFFSRKRASQEPHSTRPSGIKGGFATAMLALRLYRKYGPLVRTLVAKLASKRRTAPEDRTPAANI